MMRKLLATEFHDFSKKVMEKAVIGEKKQQIENGSLERSRN